MKKSRILITISILLIIIFLLPLITFGILNVGNIVGLFLGAICLCYGICFGKVNGKIKLLLKKKLWKVIFSVISLISAFLMIFVGFATYNMVCAANNYPDKQTTVIVLGCKVNSDGPSLTLTKRLEATYEYLTENPDVPCILSGGKGDDEHISEAQAMYDWLTEKGIDGKRLYIEDKSTTTWENISFSKEIIEKEHLPMEVTLITNNFHHYRAQQIAKRHSLEVYGVSADTPFYLLPTYYVRELGAIFMEIYIYS